MFSKAQQNYIRAKLMLIQTIMSQFIMDLIKLDYKQSEQNNITLFLLSEAEPSTTLVVFE